MNARLWLNAGFLGDLLGLPPGVRIVGARACENAYDPECLELVLEHPDFPAPGPEGKIPLAIMSCTQHRARLETRLEVGGVTLTGEQVRS